MVIYDLKQYFLKYAFISFIIKHMIASLLYYYSPQMYIAFKGATTLGQSVGQFKIAT